MQHIIILELVIKNYEKVVSGHVGNTEFQGENDPQVKCNREVQYMTAGHNDSESSF